MVMALSRVIPAQNRTGHRRRIDAVVDDQENILAAALRHTVVGIQGYGLDKPVVLGFHDQILAVDVLAANLGHGTEAVGCNAPPTGYLDVHPLFDGLLAQVPAQRDCPQNRVDGTAPAIHAQRIVTPKDQGRT